MAGVRNIALPDFLIEELRTQMKEHPGPGPEGLLFRGERGAMLRRGNFGRATDPARIWHSGERPPPEIGRGGRLPLTRDVHDACSMCRRRTTTRIR